MNIGKNNSFVCSQVDSFTPEKRAIKEFSPLQSYAKWSRTPKTDVKTKPQNCQRDKLFFISKTSPFDLAMEYMQKGAGVFI